LTRRPGADHLRPGQVDVALNPQVVRDHTGQLRRVRDRQLGQARPGQHRRIGERAGLQTQRELQRHPGEVEHAGHGRVGQPHAPRVHMRRWLDEEPPQQVGLDVRAAAVNDGPGRPGRDELGFHRPSGGIRVSVSLVVAATVHFRLMTGPSSSPGAAAGGRGAGTDSLIVRILVSRRPRPPMRRRHDSGGPVVGGNAGLL
jgi:hypothetical protein